MIVIQRSMIVIQGSVIVIWYDSDTIRKYDSKC